MCSHVNFPYGQVASPLVMCSFFTTELEEWTETIKYFTFPHKMDCSNCFWEGACCVITFSSSCIKDSCSRKQASNTWGGKRIFPYHLTGTEIFMDISPDLVVVVCFEPLEAE